MKRHYPVVASVVAAAVFLTTPVGFAARDHVARTSGAIIYLSTGQIKVNRLSCTIRTAPVSLAAARFVIGDTVTIGCRDGLLKTIKYVPPPSNGQSPAAASSPASTSGPPRAVPPVCYGTAKTTVDNSGHTFTTCWILIGGG